MGQQALTARSANIFFTCSKPDRICEETNLVDFLGLSSKIQNEC